MLEWSQIYFDSTDFQHQPSRERSDTIKNVFELSFQNLSMSMGFRKLYFVAKGVQKLFEGPKGFRIVKKVEKHWTEVSAGSS